MFLSVSNKDFTTQNTVMRLTKFASKINDIAFKKEFVCNFMETNITNYKTITFSNSRTE